MDTRPGPPDEFLSAPTPPRELLAEASPAIKLIEAAVKASMVLDLRYRIKDGDEVSLRVEPYGFRMRDGHLVVWAWNTSAGHLDSLYASRVLDASVTGIHFEPVDEWGDRA